ncbi:FCGBP protein, partial [Halcyon senegalensis]|nr:FCGBP protein [Halcyon senegalensis]
FQCRPAGCPFGQRCGLQDGGRSCVVQPGRCTLSPTTRFVTFDGAAGAAGAAGIYVVTSWCDRRRSNWFRLLVDVGEIQERVTVVGLHLFSSGPFVTIKTGEKVWVNGVPTTLPVEISSAVNITESLGTIRVTQSPEFIVELKPTGEVTVTVAQELSEGLCGLCGDYDGDAANDLQGPSGELVEGGEATAEAWRAPDFTH